MIRLFNAICAGLALAWLVSDAIAGHGVSAAFDGALLAINADSAWGRK